MSNPWILSFPEPLRAAEVKVFTSPDWGGAHHGHRERIRSSLQQILTAEYSQQVKESELQNLADLSKLPLFKNLYVSISHGPDLGGFAICKKPVGFDLELKERLQEKILRRVCSDKERTEAPSLAQLWAAKEAAFKALQTYQQAEVISELEIGRWQQGSYRLLNAEIFKAPSSGYGHAWIQGPHVYSIFMF